MFERTTAIHFISCSPDNVKLIMHTTIAPHEHPEKQHVLQCAIASLLHYQLHLQCEHTWGQAVKQSMRTGGEALGEAHTTA